MKIAIVGNNQHPITKESGFGVESFCYSLVEGFVKHGHEVILYASGDSQVSVPVISVHPVGTALDKTIAQPYQKEYQDWLYLKAYQDCKKYDLILTNDPTRSIFYSPFCSVPTFSVVHSPWDDERYPISVLTSVLTSDQRHHLIAISDYQMKKIQKGIPQVKLVRHGIEIKTIQFQPQSQDYMVFLGRINKRKGIHLAVEASIKTNKPLKISGFIAHPAEQLFFEQELQEKIKNNQHISYLNTVLDTEKKFDLISHAKAFLFPIQWEEPFGLVLIESMASGTPVIAFAHGSIPEIVEDGKTGFIVNPSDDDIRGNWIIKKTGIEGFCEAINRLYSLPQEEYNQMREASRKHVEESFTVDTMISNYEKTYQEITHL